MIKRFLLLVTAAVFLLGLAAFAQEAGSGAAASRVFDYAGVFQAGEVETLETAIAGFQEATGYDFAILVANEDLGDKDYQQTCDDFVVNQSLGLGMNHTLMLCFYDMFNSYFYILPYGDLNNILVTEDTQFLLDSVIEYINKGSFADGLVWAIGILNEALGNIDNQPQTARVFDYAQLFSDEEKAALENAIVEYRTMSGFDFVVVTTAFDLESYTGDEYMRNFYIHQGMGVGDGRDGTMVYLDMFNGSYYIHNYGSGDVDSIVTQEIVDSIKEQCDPLMGEGSILSAVQLILDGYAACFR